MINQKRKDSRGKKTTVDLFIENTEKVVENLAWDFIMHPILDLRKGPTKRRQFGEIKQALLQSSCEIQ